jgi:metal-dependent amidase/aminoacylase/carboxypeptidase family protein
MASAGEFTITVRGRGGHASMPRFAADPIPVACEIVGALQSFVTRRVDVFDPAVVTVGSIRAGTTTNVSPEVARMRGGVMAFLGTRPAGQRAAETAPNHSNKMVLAEDAVATGVAPHTAVALRRLSGESRPVAATP